MYLSARILNCRHIPLVSRSFNSTSALETKKWRESRGLPLNKNGEGILTDGPDYTFLDGRPTPLLHKQKQRMMKQQEYATKIVEYCSELDYAKQRHQKMLRDKEEERERIISGRLKAKGWEMLKKK